LGDLTQMGDNIKINHKEKCCEDLDQIKLVHDKAQWRAHMTTAMNIRVA
jgi:hypothetical protein